MYRPVIDAVSGSLALTALVAMLPLLTLFVLLGVLRMAAWKAALVSLVVSLVVAIVAYSMPVGQASMAGIEGAVFGFFPILWIVINAIWVYNMTVVTGHFDVLRRSFAKVSDDQRIQAVIIAFCFGALMEALAGFGTPVAITSVMLIALGFRPLKAATVALVANTAPVAFGALAVPITTLATVTKLPVGDLGAMVDGKRGLRQVWPAALVCGATFSVFQYLASNFWSIPLTDIIASLASALAVLAFTRVWHPKEGYVETADDAPAYGEPAWHQTHVSGDPGEGYPVAAASASDSTVRDTPGNVFKAYAPYLIIIVIFVVATRVSAITGVAPTKPGAGGTGLESATRIYDWPGLHIVSGKGKAVETTFKLNILSAAGTLLLLSGLLTMIVLKVGVGRAVRV